MKADSKIVPEKYQEIGRNLAALEAFPKEWIREVGDRIRIPVKSDYVIWAFLWHSAGFNPKQIRNLVGKRNGNLCPPWQIAQMIVDGEHRLGVREILRDVAIGRQEAYWREKWCKYKGRSKWRSFKPVKDRGLS